MEPLAEFTGAHPSIVALRQAMQRLLERQRSGRVPPVLVLGETGVGKSLLAQALHRAGPRASGPFVTVNCAAIPEPLLESELFGFERGAFTDARQAKTGLLKTAHAGTLLLDEVGLLPAALQAKLLTFLEDRMVRPLGSTRSEAVDVALIAATNADLEGAVRSGRFRRDLYYRLAVVTLQIPPLRQRDHDVIVLAEHLLGRASTQTGLPPKHLSADARAALLAHSWPGNVRELANTLERATALSEGETLTAAAIGLPVPSTSAGARGEDPGAGRGSRSPVAEADERARLARALEDCGWNISRVAAQLGISRNTVRLRIARYRLQPPEAAGSGDPPAAPAPDEPRESPHNLPRQLTTFIGREREIATVRSMVRTARLVTLTGAGGSGKTRLALEAAGGLPREFPDGVWLVDLASVADPSLVPQVTAMALGVREERRGLIEALVATIADRRLLIILDNCEHLVAATADLVQTLLQRCACPHVLATSRQSLGVPGEVTWRVPSLSMPVADRPRAAQELMQHEAIRLFVERASAAQPDFVLDETNALAVAQVCYRLDGIPLAIELAAARMRVLSVQQINARLHDRFRLLTANSRTAPARHETLAAAMDWSHELLSDDERRLFRRLSVFAGSFSLDAAEGVVAGDGFDPSRTLDLIHRLVDRSLVMVEVGAGSSRYRLLETIREYAREKLRAAGEDVAMLTRHLAWYREFAAQVEQDFLQGTDHHTLLIRWETEYDNIRAAMACQAIGPSGDAPRLELAGLMRRFWYTRGSRYEGRVWLERLLAETRQEPSLPRADALTALGQVLKRQGEVEAATACHQDALDIRRSVNDVAGIGISNINLAMLALDESDYRRATALLEETLEIWSRLDVPYQAALARNTWARVARRQGDLTRAALLGHDALRIFRANRNTYGIADTLACLGEIALEQDDVDGAEALFAESLALGRVINEFNCMADAMAGLGEVSFRRGQLIEAASMHEEALALRRRVDHPLGIASSLRSLAMIALHQDRTSAARELLTMALRVSHAVLDRVGVAESLEGRAMTNAAAESAADAARLAGLAARIRLDIGAPSPPRARALLDRALLRARASLGERQFAEAQAEGHALSPDVVL
jgi:non-specific serine/threonine protein kinase